jgi:hypothetical protein
MTILLTDSNSSNVVLEIRKYVKSSSIKYTYIGGFYIYFPTPLAIDFSYVSLIDLFLGISYSISKLQTATAKQVKVKTNTTLMLFLCKKT